MRKQISAIERLLSLPPIFRGSDLTVRFQWTSKTASHYLFLWKQRGLVRGLGGHSDVFANLLTNPAPSWEQALVMAMPSATVVGVEALRRAGWTTQAQRKPTVAVRADQPIFTLSKPVTQKNMAIESYQAYGFEGFVVQKRKVAWFERVKEGAVLLADNAAPVLKPAWALADILATEGGGNCGLWKDDIDLSEMTSEDQFDWGQACAAFGLEMQPLEAQSERSR